MPELNENTFIRDKRVSMLTEEYLIIKEIEKAKNEWICAQIKLDYVIENDQIDYAIYALGAAEKRYNMLIRQAKQININFKDHHVMEG